MRYGVYLGPLWPGTMYDLWNLIRSSVEDNEYSVSVLSELFNQFMRHRGNTISVQINKGTDGQPENNLFANTVGWWRHNKKWAYLWMYWLFISASPLHLIVTATFRNQLWAILPFFIGILIYHSTDDITDVTYAQHKYWKSLSKCHYSNLSTLLITLHKINQVYLPPDCSWPFGPCQILDELMSTSKLMLHLCF